MISWPHGFSTRFTSLRPLIASSTRGYRAAGGDEPPAPPAGGEYLSAAAGGATPPPSPEVGEREGDARPPLTARVRVRRGREPGMRQVERNVHPRPHLPVK